MKFRPRAISLSIFGVLSIVSLFFLFQLKFSFSFEQFFPKGDKDLDFFKSFIEEFEADDNFLLVAVRREGGVFEQDFLEKVHEFTLQAGQLPHVLESQSLTKLGYPIKTPFAVTTIPIIHIDDPSRYESDKKRLFQDERFVHNFISEDEETLVVFLKTVGGITFEQSGELMEGMNKLVDEFAFGEVHYLGRPYFVVELVDMQKREIIFSAIVSFLLVTLIMYFIFRKPWGIAIALISIAMGMLLFLGYMGAFGRELNAMSALYPIIMIMVGTSDVIHIMTKYIDELRKGKARKEAAIITVKEIGLATLLTSVTTAIGFASLLTSRIGPIQDLGINAAVGVMIAYVTVIGFTVVMLSGFRVDQLIKLGKGQAFWDRSMLWSYRLTRNYPRRITAGGIFVFVLCMLGISWVTTNYNIKSNLPRNSKVTEDFNFFEKHLTGFRPVEFAVFPQGDYKATDFEVVQEINKVEEKLKEIEGIRAVNSITAVYKSINQMYGGNRPEAYELPESKRQFERYQRLVSQIPMAQANVLVNKDGSKARITSRIFDIGADSVKYRVDQVQEWAAANVDPDVIQIQQTGTALIIDKNAQYVREDLVEGLGMAILIVSILMALLYQNVKMLLISLIPNVFPLLMAGALLGFLNIELEAGISIVFAAIFGIAVDDTIHFLSKYKLAINKGKSTEEALQITFAESGKAIVLTTVILFCGFLIMLFSQNPASFTVGLLISVTLFGAMISDLMLIPLFIRKFMPTEGETEETKAALEIAELEA
jgi:predicted RND superfamily exporter protein